MEGCCGATATPVDVTQLPRNGAAELSFWRCYVSHATLPVPLFGGGYECAMMCLVLNAASSYARQPGSSRAPSPQRTKRPKRGPRGHVDGALNAYNRVRRHERFPV